MTTILLTMTVAVLLIFATYLTVILLIVRGNDPLP